MNERPLFDYGPEVRKMDDEHVDRPRAEATCPACGASPGNDCSTGPIGVHVARSEAWQLQQATGLT
jgi:hypothetical protein